MRLVRCPLALLLSMLPVGCDMQQYPDCGFEVSRRLLTPPIRTPSDQIALFVLPDLPSRPSDTVAYIRHCRNDRELTPDNREVHAQARQVASECGGDAVALVFRHSVTTDREGRPVDAFTVEGTVLRWR